MKRPDKAIQPLVTAPRYNTFVHLTSSDRLVVALHIHSPQPLAPHGFPIPLTPPRKLKVAEPSAPSVAPFRKIEKNASPNTKIPLMRRTAASHQPLTTSHRQSPATTPLQFICATHVRRLAGSRPLLPFQPRHRLLLQVPRRQKRQRVFPLRTQRALVAGRHIHGGHHLRRRHAAGGHRHGGGGRHRGQLAVVEFHRQRHAHRLLLRPPVAALRRDDRYRIFRNPLLRQTRRFSARLPRALSRHSHQLHHPRLGEPGHGQDSGTGARRQQSASPRHRHRDDRAHLVHLHALRLVGRAGHRSFPVRHQDGHGYGARGVRGARRRRHRQHEGQARLGRSRARRGARLRAQLRPRPALRLDADDHIPGLHLDELVVHLVSGRRAGRRRLHRAAHVQRQGRKEFAARDAVVQHRALRRASVAMGFGRAGVADSLPRPGRSRDRLHPRDDRLLAAIPAWTDDRRLRRRLHVHHRDAAQLGRQLPGQRFLPPLLEEERNRPSLRHGLAMGHRASHHRFGRRYVLSGLHRRRLETAAGHGRGHGRRPACCAGIGGGSTPGAKCRP